LKNNKSPKFIMFNADNFVNSKQVAYNEGFFHSYELWALTFIFQTFHERFKRVKNVFDIDEKVNSKNLFF
ncbi:hypothetical protein BpHYR1_010191, partial [Brachionus plicatilis]